MEMESLLVSLNLSLIVFDPSASFDAKTRTQCTTRKSQWLVEISNSPSCNTCMSGKQNLSSHILFIYSKKKVKALILPEKHYNKEVAILENRALYIMLHFKTLMITLHVDDRTQGRGQCKKKKKFLPPILQLCLQGYSQWASPHRCDGYKNK